MVEVEVERELMAPNLKVVVEVMMVPAGLVEVEMWVCCSCMGRSPHHLEHSRYETSMREA